MFSVPNALFLRRWSNESRKLARHNGKLVHDDQKAIVIDDDQALTDQKQLQAILEQDGQPIDEVRQAID